MSCCNKRKVIDWVTILLLVGIYLFLHYGPFSPHKQCIPGETQTSNGDFECGDSLDPALDYPDIEETVSDVGLFIAAWGPWFGLILINILLFSFVKKNKNNNNNNNNNNKNDYLINNFDLHLRLMLYTSGITMIFTEIIKLGVGRPRPMYYNGEKEELTSFPSLHTSLTICTLFLMSKLFVNSINFCEKIEKNNKLKNIEKLIFNKNNNNNNGNDSNDELIVIPTNDESFEYFSVYNTHSWFLLPLWNLLRDFGGFRMIIAWIPFYLGVWVSCTRITDYKHHYGDVTAGVCLGIGCALAAENVYYNELYGNLIWMYNNINVASNESTNDAQLQDINTDNNEKN